MSIALHLEAAKVRFSVYFASIGIVNPFTAVADPQWKQKIPHSEVQNIGWLFDFEWHELRVEMIGTKNKRRREKLKRSNDHFQPGFGDRNLRHQAIFFMHRDLNATPNSNRLPRYRLLPF